MRNLLASFTEFEGKELINGRDFQDYLGKYQDLYDDWKKRRSSSQSTNINDDIIFEIELVKQIEVNIDYILLMVEKYREINGKNKELVGSDIKKAIEASPTLRSKKQLIEDFMADTNDTIDFHDFADKKREEELQKIISDENLKAQETRKFLEKSFEEGEIKTVGQDLDGILPPMSIFSPLRAVKKQTVIDKLKLLLEKFLGVCSSKFRTQI